MRYIQSFSTSGAVQEAIENQELGRPYVAYVQDGQYIDWNSKGIGYESMYLTIEALANGNLTVNLSCSYSKNGGAWTSISQNTTISVAAGDEIRFKGNLDNSANGMFSDNTLSSNVYGNILSLRYGDNFKGKNSAYDLQRTFYNYIGLKDAGNLVLPTLLQTSCYKEMFCKCKELTTAPELPATTLAQNCYYLMFQACTSLTTAPELPATTLVSNCYSNMFTNCRKLNYIKCLATSGISRTNLYSWVDDVVASGTFVKDSNATWTTSKNGIPSGWTVIDAQS